MATPQEFLTEYYPYAAKASSYVGHDPLFLLAQSVAERGYKGSGVSKTANNFFGITAYEGTSWKGAIYRATTGIPFRWYPTLQDSFNDYIRLIYDPKSKYYTKVRKQGTIEEFAYDISRSAYISETNGDNREVYRDNIVKAYYTLVKLNKPFVWAEWQTPIFVTTAALVAGTLTYGVMMQPEWWKKIVKPKKTVPN